MEDNNSRYWKNEFPRSRISNIGRSHGIAQMPELYVVRCELRQSGSGPLMLISTMGLASLILTETKKELVVEVALFLIYFIKNILSIKANTAPVLL